MKTSVENYIFWSEIGSGFEELCGTPPPRIPRGTPPLPGGITLAVLTRKENSEYIFTPAYIFI